MVTHIYCFYILYIFIYNIKYKNINIYIHVNIFIKYILCVYLCIYNIHSTHTYIYYVNKKVWHIFTIIATNNIFKQYNIIIIYYVKIYNRINIQFLKKRHCLFYLFTENTRVCACVRACVKRREAQYSAADEMCACVCEKKADEGRKIREKDDSTQRLKTVLSLISWPPADPETESWEPTEWPGSPWPFQAEHEAPQPSPPELQPHWSPAL